MQTRIWREYLYNGIGIDKEAYILRDKVDKLTKTASIFPFIFIGSLILSSFFLLNLPEATSTSHIISLQLLPGIIGVFIIYFLAFCHYHKIEDAYTTYDFLYYVYFILTLILFFKFFIFTPPFELFDSSSDIIIYIPGFGNLDFNALTRTQCGVVFLLISSISCIATSKYRNKIRLTIRTIESIIDSHKQQKEKDRVAYLNKKD